MAREIFHSEFGPNLAIAATSKGHLLKNSWQNVPKF